MIFSAYVFFCFSKVDASFAVLFLSQKNIDLFSVSGNILSSVSVGIVNKFALKEKETSWCAVAFPCGMSGLFLTQPVCLESLQSDDVVGCLVASVTAFWLEEHVLFISWFGEMKALRTLSSRDLLFFYSERHWMQEVAFRHPVVVVQQQNANLYSWGILLYFDFRNKVKSKLPSLLCFTTKGPR